MRDMIRGAAILLKAESEEEVLSRPDIKPVKYNADLILEILQKHKKDGVTNAEIAKASGVKLRRVREETQKLKQQGVLKEKTCRCTRTPIYYIL